MALKYLVDLNINDNVLQNARLFSSGTAPTAAIGAIFVDTGDSNKLKYHNGTAFVALGTGTATGDLTAIVAGSGMTGTSLSGPIPTLNVIGGDGITANANDIEITPAQTTITSIYNANLIVGRASDDARITFAEDTLTLVCNNDGQCGVTLANQVFKPVTTNDISLGTADREFKNAFFSGTVTSDAFAGPLTGNASTATTLATARTIGGTSFNGSANIAVALAATATTLATARTIGGVSFNGSANINLPGVNAAGTQNTSGSAATLTTARAINGVDFDGSAAITVTAAASSLSGTTIKSTVLTSSLTTVGALNAGSITSGFGAIDVGASAISAGSFDASDGNITNVGSISLDAIIADGSAVTIATDTSGDTVTIGHTTSEVTIGDNLTIAGDLTVQGTTTTVDSTTVAIGDNMMKYAKDNTGNASDIGWYGKIVATGTKFPAMFYRASSGISTPLFDVGLTTDEPGGTGAIAVKGTVVANLSGNVTGNVTGNVSGTAGSAATLTTARTIGGVSFNGSANINLPGVNATGTQNTSGNADTASVLGTARTIGGVSFNGGANINLPGVNAAGTQNTSGVAATATALATARTIGGTSFDGTGNIAVALAADATTLATARTIGGVSFDGSANINLPGVNAAGTQATSGNAATASILATGRTIAMSGDVAWTSASFNGGGNVTGTSTIQAAAVAESMLEVKLRGKQLTLNSGTSGITRSFNAGSNGLTIFVLTLNTLYGTGDPDGRLIQVELYEASTYATVYADVARAAATVTITMKGDIDDSDYGILLKPVTG